MSLLQDLDIVQLQMREGMLELKQPFKPEVEVEENPFDELGDALKQVLGSQYKSATVSNKHRPENQDNYYSLHVDPFAVYLRERSPFAVNDYEYRFGEDNIRQNGQEMDLSFSDLLLKNLNNIARDINDGKARVIGSRREELDGDTTQPGI